jgi:hypothetical protein
LKIELLSYLAVSACHLRKSHISHAAISVPTKKKMNDWMP